MTSRVTLLLAAALVGGCRAQTSDAERTLRGTAADSAITGDSNQLGAANAGVEFEAPRLIPGVLASMQVVTEGKGKVDEGTAAGYRQAAGTLVDAMLTDLNRVGVGDDGSFRARGDSVVTLVGGGPGDAPSPDPDRLMRSATQLRGLIDTYQERMRSAQQ